MLRVTIAPPDGVRQTMFAYDDAAERVPSDLASTPATLTCGARSVETGARKTLTAALADAGDPARANEIVVTAGTSDWAAGLYEAALRIVDGAVSRTFRFQIMIEEDIL